MCIYYPHTHKYQCGDDTFLLPIKIEKLYKSVRQFSKHYITWHNFFLPFSSSSLSLTHISFIISNEIFIYKIDSDFLSCQSIHLFFICYLVLIGCPIFFFIIVGNYCKITSITFFGALHFNEICLKFSFNSYL